MKQLVAFGQEVWPQLHPLLPSLLPCIILVPMPPKLPGLVGQKTPSWEGPCAVTCCVCASSALEPSLPNEKIKWQNYPVGEDVRMLCNMQFLIILIFMCVMGWVLIHHPQLYAPLVWHPLMSCLERCSTDSAP